MPLANTNGISLEYEITGEPAAPPIVLIMGLGMQLTSWPDPLRDGLVARGFRVSAFDNRDAGLSTRVRARRRPNLMLQIARAWARRPEVLFLDEPTANLDPAANREIETTIESIHAEGTKIIMTTHNLGQARRLGDEILFLQDGRLIERGPVDDFFLRPASAEAAAFIKGELPD